MWQVLVISLYFKYLQQFDVKNSYFWLHVCTSVTESAIIVFLCSSPPCERPYWGWNLWEARWKVPNVCLSLTVQLWIKHCITKSRITLRCFYKVDTDMLQDLQNQLQQMSFRNLVLEGHDICSALISSLISRSACTDVYSMTKTLCIIL